MQTRTRRSGAGRGPGARSRTGPGRQLTRARRAPTPLTGWRVLPRATEVPPSPRPSWAEAPAATVPARGARTGQPPPSPATDPPATDPPSTDQPATDPPPTDPPHEQGPVEPADPAPPASVFPLPPLRRLRLALVDRLPGRAGARCGMEPRTLAALALLLLVAVGLAVHHFWTGRPQPVALTEPVTASASPSPTASASPTDDGSLVVDVSGDVREPGVYTLPAGSRVADALAAAGGAEPGADTATLNRARLLVDGEQVVVGAPAATPAGTPAAGPDAVPDAGAATGRVSLNSATAEQLEALPGIGPVLAAHIIDHREQIGGFSTVEELLDVSGIGESRLAELRDHVSP